MARTAGLILAAGVLAVSLAVGQALLFDGRRPRDASILVGACVLPVIVFFAACMETVGSERWSDAWPAVLSCTAMALCVGPVIGYLVGIFLAGGFFMFDHWWLGTNTIGRWIGPAEPQPMDGQVLRWLQKQPARFRGHAGRMSLAVIGWCLLFACVVTPALRDLTIQFRLIVLVGFVCAAVFLSGSLHLRWRSLWILLVSCSTALPVAGAASRIVYVSDYASEGMIRLAVTLAALAAGLVVMALLGWTQLAVGYWLRKDVLLDRTSVLLGYCLVCILASLWARSHVVRINQSPSERALAGVRQLGGNVVYRFQGFVPRPFPPPLESIYLTGGNGDSCIAILARDVDLSSLRDLTINSTLSDEGLRSLHGLRLHYLSLATTRISPRAFADLDLSVDALDLSSTRVSDQTLADLAAVEEVRRRLRWLCLDSTRMSDDGLPALLRFTSLQSISLVGCAITGRGFAEGNPIPILRNLSVQDTLLDDVGLSAVVQVFPSLRYIDLRGTRVTDQGLSRLGRLAGLARLEVNPGQFSGDGLADLCRRFPSLEIDDAG